MHIFNILNIETRQSDNYGRRNFYWLRSLSFKFVCDSCSKRNAPRYLSFNLKSAKELYKSIDFNRTTDICNICLNKKWEGEMATHEEYYKFNSINNLISLIGVLS